MKNLSIMVDEELHTKVKIKAIKSKKNVREYLLALIEKDMGEEDKKDE